MEENQVLTTNQKIVITSIWYSPLLLTPINPLLTFLVGIMECGLMLLVLAIWLAIYYMNQDNNRSDNSNNCNTK